MLAFSPFSAPTHPLWNCILDPDLTLSTYGIPLVKHLGKAMELWVVRELWQILDNPRSYLQSLPPLPFSAPVGQASMQTTWNDRNRAISAWERFLDETNLTSLNLFWFGDRPRESVLPRHQNLDIFWRWEALARSLDQRYAANSAIPLMLAFRDAIALVTCLNSAFVLTYQEADNGNREASPVICQRLQFWNIPCQKLSDTDPMVALERNTLTQLLLQAGLCQLLWTELRLVILHIVAPHAFSPIADFRLAGTRSTLGEAREEFPNAERSLWLDAQGFWYPL